MTVLRRLFLRSCAVLSLLLLLASPGRGADADQVLILASQATISESVATPVTFTFIRLNIIDDLTVNFTISGSATIGDDFVTTPDIDDSLSDSIIIPAGLPSVSITVMIEDDSLAETAETITVTIDDDEAMGANYTTLLIDSDSVVILDDEPVLEIALNATASEPTTDGSFTVSYPGLARDYAVPFTFVADGTALVGVDYQALVTIEIPADVNSVYIPVTIINDALADNGKILTVSLTSSSNYQIKPGAGIADMTLGNDDTGVTSVSSSSPDGTTYLLDATIVVTVTFSEAVAVTGSPTLALATGSTPALAQYLNGTGTTTLSFRYTVGPDDFSGDLDYTGISALTLNGGTISKSGTTNAAVLTLPVPGQTGSLSDNRELAVDGLTNGQKPVPGSVQSTDSQTSQCGFGSGVSALLLLCMLAGMTLSIRRIQR